MTDPLSILRDFHIKKKDVVVQDDQIIFGDIAFKKNAKTNHLRYGSETDSLEKEYYTLDCLLYFLQNTDLRHPIYVNKARIENLTVVKRPDRRDLLDYLSGERAASARIDPDGPLELPVCFHCTPVELSVPHVKVEIPIPHAQLEIPILCAQVELPVSIERAAEDNSLTRRRRRGGRQRRRDAKNRRRNRKHHIIGTSPNPLT